ncbi:MAG: hypothetical protein IKY52_14335 [Clostridia bacterium]|nr:hypothetical protein [Clostridia bacterium]
MFAKLYYYQNFTIPSGFDSLDVMVWGMYIGIMLGVIFSTVDKVFCRKMINGLLAGGAVTPETALPLNKMDIGGKWYLRWALREGKPLRKMLAMAEGTDSRTKAGDVLFYLPEEKKFAAENRYDPGHRPFMSLFLIGILLLAAVFFVLFMVPELLTMLDNLVGFMKYGE